MTRRTSIIVWGAAGLLLVIWAAAPLLTGRLDGYVQDVVEDRVSATTGTHAELDKVDLAIVDARGELGGLTIDNPEGYSTDYFLRIDDIAVSLQPRSLTTDVPVVTEVLVDSAHLNAEQRGRVSNLTDIRAHILAPPAAPTPSQEEGRIVIDRFRLTNARITVTSDALDESEDLMLADVVVEGIGRNSGGATYGEASGAILNAIVGAARTAVEGRLRDAALDAARDEAEEQTRERVEELLDRI
jgi:hypothetical protein